MNNLIFLENRMRDKKRFSFSYKNTKDEISTITPIEILSIDKQMGNVELLLSNHKSYFYKISKMSIHEENTTSNVNINNFRNTQQVEPYLTNIVKTLIHENSSGKNDTSALNYSLQNVMELLSSSKNTRLTSALYKKYIRGEGAIQKQYNEILVLPFLSNITQKNAITNALKYDVSIISGPPGTGKTQTILNIICNYVVQGKRVCVVSKNNSAIDNVYEKIEKLDHLNNFAIRLGNSKEYIPNLMESLSDKLMSDFCKCDNIISTIEVKDLNALYEEIVNLEEELDDLIRKRNILFEVKAQKRHIDRKIKLYSTHLPKIEVNPFFVSPRMLKKEIDSLKLKKGIDSKGDRGLLFKFYTRFRFREKDIDTSMYTMYEWRLEELYANKLIRNLENQIGNIDELENVIAVKYKDYNSMSIEIINRKISHHYKSRENSYIEILKHKDKEFYQVRKQILNFYPVVLTTLDSLYSNIKDEKYDVVIIDEASQTNILSCLPALNAGNSIVVVGDDKQLSHIVSENVKQIDAQFMKQFNISDTYSFSKTNGMESIKNAFNAPRTLLTEHYRCDYNIINFCNKMFYDGQLKVYKNSSNKNSMRVMNLDNERNSDVNIRSSSRGVSYYNKVEELAIVKLAKKDCSNLSIITPYGLQEENLKNQLLGLQNEVGTVYKFQGRENKKVYLSTVLTKERNHCTEKNPINNELINVAVSRAEEEFVLFTHKKFFKEINHPLIHLISYIETYGEELKSNVNSIFAHLYKQMDYIRLDNQYDSIWEKSVHEVLLDVQNSHKGFFVVMKQSLADVIVDEKYLNNHPEFKSFALNKNTHLDFLLISELNGQPILAIEVDGKYHKEDIQKERDAKKDQILTDYNIPVWRIKSTDAIEKEFVDIYITDVITKFEAELIEFLNNNTWKV